MALNGINRGNGLQGLFGCKCFIIKVENWSERWELNPRHSRWQRDALPLSYARIRKAYKLISHI